MHLEIFDESDSKFGFELDDAAELSFLLVPYSTVTHLECKQKRSDIASHTNRNQQHNFQDIYTSTPTKSMVH